MRNRSSQLSGLFLLALALVLSSAVAGCADVLSLDRYRFCAAGSERCPCKANDRCNAGLECRDPGICVHPESDTDASAAAADGGDHTDQSVPDANASIDASAGQDASASDAAMSMDDSGS